jgi:hypothetical protein
VLLDLVQLFPQLCFLLEPRVLLALLDNLAPKVVLALDPLQEFLPLLVVLFARLLQPLCLLKLSRLQLRLQPPPFFCPTLLLFLFFVAQGAHALAKTIVLLLYIYVALELFKYLSDLLVVLVLENEYISSSFLGLFDFAPSAHLFLLKQSNAVG